MAKENATNENAGEQQAPEKSGGMKQLLFAALLMLGLVVGSGSAAVIMASFLIKPAAAPASAATGDGETAAAEDADAEEAGDDAKKADGENANRPTVAFEEQITVNVYKTKQRRFLCCKPVFVMLDDAAQKKLQERMVDLKDLLIQILKTKTLEELDEPGVTSELGREIVESVNNRLNLGQGVVEVKFAQFVVQ